ncbi:MAG: hypothetical protein QXS91_00530 [Candidatus Anstonellales archaeon]
MAIETSMEELNELLGPIKEGDIILITFNDKNTARIFSQYLVPKKGNAIIISTDFKPDTINANAIFIDAYSLERGVKPREGDRAVYVSSINDISLETSQLISDKQINAVIILSISTLLKKNPKDAVMRFIDLISARIKETGGALILLSDEKGEDIDTLEALANINIKLTTKDNNVLLTSNAFPFPLELIIFADKMVVK